MKWLQFLLQSYAPKCTYFLKQAIDLQTHYSYKDFLSELNMNNYETWVIWLHCIISKIQKANLPILDKSKSSLSHTSGVSCPKKSLSGRTSSLSLTSDKLTADGAVSVSKECRYLASIWILVLSAWGVEGILVDFIPLDLSLEPAKVPVPLSRFYSHSKLINVTWWKQHTLMQVIPKLAYSSV